MAQEGASDIANRDIYCQWMSGQYSQSKNFYSYLLSTICPSFLLEYVCNLDGESYLEHPQVNSIQETSMQVLTSGLSYSLASKYQKSLGQVVTSSQGVPIWGDGSTKAMGARIAGYPNPAAPEEGRYVTTQAPGWFKGTSYNKDQNFLAEIEGHRSPGQIADEDLEVLRDKVESRPSHEQLGYSFLEAWSHKQYNLWALKNTTATFEIPLDVTWGTKEKPIGRRYQMMIQNPAGPVPVMMRGYLNRVMHTVDVNGDSSTGSAQTVLDFTHIKTPDFVLPGDK